MHGRKTLQNGGKLPLDRCSLRSLCSLRLNHELLTTKIAKAEIALLEALMIACCFLVLISRGADAQAAVGNSSEIETLIQLLGDPRLSSQKHIEAADALQKSGKAAIPALIHALQDQRVYFPHWEVPNSGAIHNQYMDLTVGEACDLILLAIITPPNCGGVGYPKVTDWPSWWKKHKDMSLEAIQKEVRDNEPPEYRSR
jgi:hypothetical protein